jgi:hypothetical protein
MPLEDVSLVEALQTLELQEEVEDLFQAVEPLVEVQLAQTPTYLVTVLPVQEVSTYLVTVKIAAQSPGVDS